MTIRDTMTVRLGTDLVEEIRMTAAARDLKPATFLRALITQGMRRTRGEPLDEYRPSAAVQRELLFISAYVTKVLLQREGKDGLKATRTATERHMSEVLRIRPETSGYWLEPPEVWLGAAADDAPKKRRLPAHEKRGGEAPQDGLPVGPFVERGEDEPLEEWVDRCHMPSTAATRPKRAGVKRSKRVKR